MVSSLSVNIKQDLMTEMEMPAGQLNTIIKVELAVSQGAYVPDEIFPSMEYYNEQRNIL